MYIVFKTEMRDREMEQTLLGVYDSRESAANAMSDEFFSLLEMLSCECEDEDEFVETTENNIGIEKDGFCYYDDDGDYGLECRMFHTEKCRS